MILQQIRGLGRAVRKSAAFGPLCIGVGAAVVMAVALQAPPAQARSLGFQPYADSYGILTGSEAGGKAGTFTFSGASSSTTAVTGSVGVGNNEALTGTTPNGTISGELYKGSAVTGSLAATISGGTSTSTNPATGIGNAITFSQQAGALAATQTVTGNAISLSNSSQTITLSSGQNVLNLTSLSLATTGSSSSKLTISGTAGELLIVNVSGNFSVEGRSSIVLSGGITAADVIFNVTGTGGSVTVSGASSTHAQTIAGTILAPNDNITLSGYTTLTGSVIGAFGTSSTAYNFSDTANFKISYMAYAPEPSSLAVIGVALGALGFIRRRKRGEAGTPTPA